MGTQTTVRLTTPLSTGERWLLPRDSTPLAARAPKHRGALAASLLAVGCMHCLSGRCSGCNRADPGGYVRYNCRCCPAPTNSTAAPAPSS